MLEFAALSSQCAPEVSASTMQAVVQVESSYNPYAIGVVGGNLKKQPKNLQEAVTTAQFLEKQGFNFSLGMAQVNRKNLRKYQMSYQDAFNPCKNLSAGSSILTDCFKQAKKQFKDSQSALKAAFSCYYSGNFIRGFQPEKQGLSYVQKVLASHQKIQSKKIVVPAIESSSKPVQHSHPKPFVFEESSSRERRVAQHDTNSVLVF